MPLNSYILYLIASLAFYVAGILMIVSNNRTSDAAFIALGCAFLAIALNRRKRNK